MLHALYQAESNGHSFIPKIDSGASHNCISKTLWDKIKTSNKLIKSTITGAGGSMHNPVSHNCAIIHVVHL